MTATVIPLRKPSPNEADLANARRLISSVDPNGFGYADIMTTLDGERYIAVCLGTVCYRVVQDRSAGDWVVKSEPDPREHWPAFDVCRTASASSAIAALEELLVVLQQLL